MIATARQRLRWIVLTAATAALLLVGVTAASAALTDRTGTTVTRTAVVTDSVGTVYHGSAWANVASTSLYATASEFIVATFSAESVCWGTAGGFCSVRILIDGIEADPASGSDFAFRHVAAANAWDSASVMRVLTVGFSGTHTVVVQAAGNGANVFDRLDDWTLVAQANTP